MRYFKKSLLVLFVFISLQCNKNEWLQWEENVRLEWSDFEGDPDHLTTFDAATQTGFTDFQCKCDPTTGIIITGGKACLDRKKSWVKEDKRLEDLLNHERRHFDITEIYARRLKKALRSLRCVNTTLEKLQAEVHSVYVRIEKEWKQEMNVYDAETDHGKNKTQQKRWEEKIQKELAETRPDNEEE